MKSSIDPIITQLQTCFPDISCDDFNSIALPALKNLIEKPPQDLRINPNSILLQHGINRMHFDDKDQYQKKLLTNLRLLFCCAYVLLYQQKVGWKNQRGNDSCSTWTRSMFLKACLCHDTFQKVYNQNSLLDVQDVPHMYHYWRYLCIVMQLLRGDRIKTLAIQIAGRLDGTNRSYSFGTSQSNAVNRRVCIFNMELDGTLYSSDVPADTLSHLAHAAEDKKTCAIPITEEPAPIKLTEGLSLKQPIKQRKRKRDVDESTPRAPPTLPVDVRYSHFCSERADILMHNYDEDTTFLDSLDPSMLLEGFEKEMNVSLLL